LRFVRANSVLIVFSALALPALVVSGCGRESADSPPRVVLDDSVCVECGMIISDERFATATVVVGDRGPEPRLFDDFNCQINYEIAHAGDAVSARWSHDYLSGEWVRTEGASFLRSAGLRTPMGSGVAAFAGREDAEEARGELGGELTTFDAMRNEALAGG